MFILFSLFSLLLLSINLDGHISFHDVQKYAETHTEFPNPTILDWLNPQYTSFYMENKPTVFQKIFHALGLSNSLWSIDALNTLIEQRLINLDHTKKNKLYVSRIDTSSNPTLYVWGDVHGSFHSLFRALRFLKKESIIDDSLKIIKPNVFFVFNGNLINGAPYSLETLILILTILRVNPSHALYLRGQQEHANYWKDFDMRYQLILYGNLNDEKKRAKQENIINAFFESLPVALYCSNSEKSPDQIIRISSFDQSTRWIDESLMGSFFIEQQKDSFITYPLEKKEQSKNIPFICAEIRSMQWKNDYRATQGLCLMDQDNGATTWTLLSCPTAAYQAFYNFYYDAFTKIECKSPLEQSTISLCNRDIRYEKDFDYHAPYNLYTGTFAHDATQYSAAKDIIVGSSMSLIQGVPIMGKRTLHGMMACITQENKKGGINGRLIRVTAKNDNYNPSLARKNILNFLNHDINTILLPVGSPTLSSYLDLVKEQKILVLFPISGNITFRDSSLQNIIHFRCSYTDEVKALLEYAYTEWNVRKFALFYQDDSYGQGPRDTAHTLLTQKNCTFIDVPYSRAAINMKQQAQKINDFQPDVIAFFSTAQTTIELIREIGIENIINKKLLGISFCAEESFRIFSQQHNISILTGSVVPNPFISDIAIVKEYRAAMDEAGYSYDTFSLEAYIATSILIEILKKIDAPFTKEKIYKELTAIKDMSLKGITLSYNPTTHTVYDTVYLETGSSNEWIATKIGVAKS